MVKRNVTRRDVALKAGVSATTVSFVLNNRTEANISEETQQRVLEAAQMLGYVPSAAAQALASGRTKTIGLIIGGKDFSASDARAEVLFGVLEVARQNNLRLLVDQAVETGQKDFYLKLAKAKSIDGLIIPEPSLNDPGIQFLADYNFPVVVLGHLPAYKLTEIDFDNEGGARAIMEHLLSLGHTRIACITHTSYLNNSGMNERLIGYKKALAAAGIPFNEDLVRYGLDTEISGYKNMLSILDAGQMPTAVFGLNDAVALGAMKAIQERGLKVPQNIAIAGFDDKAFARFLNPSLTSVKLPFEELGQRAAEMLLDLINEKVASGLQSTVPTELFVRKSTDPNAHPILL